MNRTRAIAVALLAATLAGCTRRTITTYDWSVEPSPDPIVLPSAPAPTDG